MKKTLLAAALSAVFIFSVQGAHAALNSYLQLRGTKTTKFNPTVQSGWYQALCTNEVITGIVSPRDPASGQATGKRQHMPLRVRMYYDQSSVQSLKNAFATKEPIRSATLYLHRPATSKSAKQVYMRIELENVQITSYQIGVLDGKPAVSIALQYETVKRTPVSKTVGIQAWKQGFTIAASARA